MTAGVLDTVSAAFRQDPAFRFFFPEDSSYPELVDRFVGRLFDRRLATQSAWVVDGGAAVALWDPPPDPDGGPGSGDADHSAPDLPDDVRSRLDHWDSTVHGLLPAEPHWYLGVLATAPQHAGRRLGRTAMGAGLARAVGDGVPAFLETATDSNVALYRSCGWDVVGTAEVEDLEVRVMRHPGGSGS